MRVENRTRKTILGSDVCLVATWWGRLRGYIGHSEPPMGEGLLLIPCDGIHTFGMKFDLDVVFLDSHGTVLEIVKSLRPWKWTRRVKNCRSVLEVPAGMVDRSGTQVEDRLAWWEPAPAPMSDLIANRRPWESQSASPRGGNE